MGADSVVAAPNPSVGGSMKLTIRLTTLAIAAVAFAGLAGAQQRNGGHGSARSQAPSGQSGSARSRAPSGQSGSRAGQSVRTQHYAPSRAEIGRGPKAVRRGGQ